MILKLVMKYLVYFIVIGLRYQEDLKIIYQHQKLIIINHIHTAVIGPNKERIEIQIRTQQMHEFAERGIASHWIYKSSEKLSHLALKEYDWLRDLVEIMEKDTNPEHFLEYTKLQMFQDNVFCFTPKGEVIKLPRGATPIDFAYAVHTKIGDGLIAHVKLTEEDHLCKVF